jgi:Rad3-related DNA helicase
VSDEQVVSKPEALLRAIARLVEELAESQISLEAFPQARELVVACFRWARSETWYDEARCIHLAHAQDREFTVRRVHLDPAAYLQQILKGFGGHIRFSGTVSPLALYQKLHGIEDGPAERAGSPFAAEQLDVLIVDDVPTYWRARERSLERLVGLIATVVSAEPGNYLVALPSFAYLRCVTDALQSACPDLNLAVQAPAMSTDERVAFIERFDDASVDSFGNTSADTSARTIGLVVMGGVFAESVDFAAMAGVVCVGVGLPPPVLERKALEAYCTAQGDDGHAVAFQQPAMTKILQMAGRLLRDPGDRGVLCLIDARFKDSAYQRFFPEHWQPRVVAAAQVADRLDKFWQGASGSPRLRA